MLQTYKRVRQPTEHHKDWLHMCFRIWRLNYCKFDKDCQVSALNEKSLSSQNRYQELPLDLLKLIKVDIMQW